MADHTYRYKKCPPDLSNVGVTTTIMGESPIVVYVDVQCDDAAKDDLDYVMERQCWEYVEQDPPAAPPFVVLQQGTGNPYSVYVDGVGDVKATAI